MYVLVCVYACVYVLPLPHLQRRIALGDVARQGEDVGESQLAGGDGVTPGSVDYLYVCVCVC
jgi:hypothetical protein